MLLDTGPLGPSEDANKRLFDDAMATGAFDVSKSQWTQHGHMACGSLISARDSQPLAQSLHLSHCSHLSHLSQCSSLACLVPFAGLAVLEALARLSHTCLAQLSPC